MSAKKSWSTPQLVILIRGTPEEAVLTHCKRIGDPHDYVTAIGSTQTGCDRSAENKNCGNCQSRSGS